MPPSEWKGLLGQEKGRKQEIMSVPCLVLPQPRQGLPHIQQLQSTREPRFLQESLLHPLKSEVAVRLLRDPHSLFKSSRHILLNSLESALL